MDLGQNLVGHHKVEGMVIREIIEFNRGYMI